MTSKDSVFSAKSKTFAHVSPDNRLHLWDVDTRKEKKAYVDKNHLSHSTTCFSWKKSKKDKTGEFVVGFSDGTIVIWDLTRGVISRTIGKVNESPSPTDIVFSNDSNSIFVSSNNNNVVKYNLTSGEVEKSIKAGKKGILKLASNPKANVIAAARYVIYSCLHDMIITETILVHQ
jgi:WD40 repeat protein